MDVTLLIKHRLNELGLEQKDLAAAAQVTESYISQLLARKKIPPAPERTDIYEKLGPVLGLQSGELSKLAGLQRREEIKKKVVDPPMPLFKECRELILRKCAPKTQGELHRTFAKDPFGELERLVTRTLLDVAQGVAREELRSEDRLRVLAQLSGRSYEQVRVEILEFLDTDIFHVSMQNCVTFLDPIIESWDIDINTFSIEIVLNQRLASHGRKRFEFVEIAPEGPFTIEPGLEQFLKDPALRGDITEDETQFLKALKFHGRHPSPLYYYRELQNLRDPIHFPADTPARRRT